MTPTPIYLDHNASTPIDEAVIKAMVQSMRVHYANPSSVEHAAGSLAHAAVEEARDQVTKAIHCRKNEVVFTSGSTEANNLAIRGAFPGLKSAGRRQIITSAIEHPSVLEAINALKSDGAEITILPVDEGGKISITDLEATVTENTGLVSVMAANNETGVQQPIKEIGEICARAGALFHTDYSQATAYVPIDVSKASIHLASFSGHKMYGPKGVGALYARIRKPRVGLAPIIFGGGQERGLRSGTLNTHGIVGLGKAFELARSRQTDDAIDIACRRDQLERAIEKIPDARINGKCENRLPNTLSVSIAGVEPLALMHALRDEVVFSASSACSTDKVETSYVLKAMFGDTPRAREAFRLGLGRGTCDDDVEIAALAMAETVARLRTNGV